MHEAATLLPDGADEATLEPAILEAVVLAETKCQSDWLLIQKLTQELPEGEVRTAFYSAVEQVEEQKTSTSAGRGRPGNSWL